MSDAGFAAPAAPVASLRWDIAARFRPIRTSDRLTDFCAAATAAILWGLGHTYVGIEGDSRIYMGRALADLDPAGVGRDLMFAMDGQSSFTVFRVLARELVTAIGFGPAVATIGVVNLAVWFLALVALVRAFVPGRAAILVLAVACVLPRLYTPWNLLAAGESISVPRPLAEAGVLFAFAALAHGRFILAAGCLAVAALFHPIMAAPGCAVLLIALGLRDWRWLAGAALVGVTIVGAAVAGAPFVSRLAVKIDPEWLDLLLRRNPYLFLHFWPWDSVGPQIVQIFTIFLACRWLEKPVRIVLLASVAVATLGCAASYLLGDVLANLLVIQAQLWRALWLPAVLGPIAAGICLWRLPRSGPRGQLALPLMCLAWTTLDAFPLAPAAAVAAFAIVSVFPAKQLNLSRSMIVVVWIVCAIFAAGSMMASAVVLKTMVEGMPPEGGVWSLIWSLRFQTIPVALVFSVWWFAPRTPAVRAAAPVVTALCAVLFYFTWDLRTPAHRDADAAVIKPDLVKMLASRPGSVLWVDGDDLWYWARRPNWNGQTQGGGIVFSRRLGMIWQERAQLMLDHGLATSYLLNPWGDAISLKALTLDPGKVKTFCQRSDAPAWIVASLEPGAQPPAGLDAQVWSPPNGHWKYYIADNKVRWRHLDRYAVVPCAPSAS